MKYNIYLHTFTEEAILEQIQFCFISWLHTFTLVWSCEQTSGLFLLSYTHTSAKVQFINHLPTKVLLFTSFSGQGDALGPHYSVSSHSCNSESECNQSMGETCLWLYEGCTMGRCMCDPRVHIQDSNGKCRLSKYTYARIIKHCCVVKILVLVSSEIAFSSNSVSRSMSLSTLPYHESG